MTPIDKLVRNNIRNLKPYSSAREEYTGLAGIYMDANENPFGKLNRYPDPFQTKLKQSISKLKCVPVENIFLGNGSDEIIDLCFRLFCEPRKDKALTFTPTYGMYKVAADINDIEMIEIDLNDEFQIDISSVKDYLDSDNLKIIFICSPNNPTGNDILNIDYILQHFDGIVVVDEAYIDFAGKKSYTNDLLKHPNLIVLQTLSKAWGKAAARVGMAFAGPEIIAYLNRIKPPYNVSTPNQVAARKAIQQKQLFKKHMKIIIEQREILARMLKTIPVVKKIYPSQTNFILVQVSDADAIHDILVSKNIIVRNRSKEVPGCLRVTVGTPDQNHLLIKVLMSLNP